MNETNPNEKLKPLAALLGYEPVRIEYRDEKDRQGKAEEVMVRQLPLSAMPRLAEVLDNDAALIELLCDEAPGWADRLKPESVEAIIEAGDRLNADFFAQWAARRRRRMEQLLPSIWPNSAPTSPSPEDSALTK